MSTLKTNTLTGTTSAGSIVVTGEGGSTTTNLQQGLVKVWTFYDVDSDGIHDSFNTASFTDTGSGDSTIAYTNNMNSVNRKEEAKVLAQRLKEYEGTEKALLARRASMSVPVSSTITTVGIGIGTGR